MKICKGGDKMSKKKTHEEYVEELADKNPHVKVIEKYIGVNVPIKHYCTKHNIYWNISPHNALCGRGCKKCGKESRAATRRKTHSTYVEELKIKNPTLEVVEQYVNSHTPILHHCLVHDIFWSTTPTRALAGVGCEECRKEKFRQVRCKTHEEYIREVKKVNPNIDVVGQYVDAKTPIEHYCNKHSISWRSYPDNILRGIGCKECGNEKAREKNIKSHSQYVKDLDFVNPSIEVIEEYQGVNTAILHRCKIDGYVWRAQPANILFSKGCPQCNESKGERQVRQWLDKNIISFIYQKTFTDCIDLRVLPFDFYIPKYNLCIEYDGEQHFRPVDFNGKGDEWANQQFLTTQKHDEIKNQYCKDNNISLLRIPYFKSVEEELETFFIHLI